MNTILKKYVISLTVFSLVFYAFLLNTTQVKALYTAGSPGWDQTIEGLVGEAAFPNYIASPDHYTSHDTATINVNVTNVTSSTVEVPMYLVLSQVIESPLGTNVSDGQPHTSGMTESQLNQNHQGGNDLQQIAAVSNTGNFTLLPHVSTRISSSITIPAAGYYQFDLMTYDPRSGYVPGHIVAAGFIRALDASNSTSSKFDVKYYCDGNFEASMTLFSANQPANGVSVNFTYRGQSIQQTTNQDGIAAAIFNYTGSDNLIVTANGYGSWTESINRQSCEPRNNQGSTNNPGNQGQNQPPAGGNGTNGSQVLGIQDEESSTPSATTPATTSGVVKGTNTVCTNRILWWIPLIAQGLIGLLIQFLYRKKGNQSKRVLLIILILAVVSEIAHWIIGCPCETKGMCAYYPWFDLGILALTWGSGFITPQKMR